MGRPLATFSRPRARWSRPQFSMDNGRPLALLGGMAQPERKLVTPVSLVVDAILVIGFFVYMYGVCKPRVPSDDPKMIVLWGALTAGCLTGVFWLALQMFRVVFAAQRAAKR
jgi:hypothetical protein